jgi:hypothetical protein
MITKKDFKMRKSFAIIISAALLTGCAGTRRMTTAELLSAYHKDEGPTPTQYGSAADLVGFAYTSNNDIKEGLSANYHLGFSQTLPHLRIGARYLHEFGDKLQENFLGSASIGLWLPGRTRLDIGAACGAKSCAPEGTLSMTLLEPFGIEFSFPINTTNTNTSSTYFRAGISWIWSIDKSSNTWLRFPGAFSANGR